MIKIMCDTCSQLTPEQAKLQGVDAIPMQIIMDDVAFKEFVELSSETLLNKIIVEHKIPTSSQPTPYDVKTLFEQLKQDEKALVITIADGLSGTYNTVCSMRMTAENPTNIYVYNSQTIAGPQQHMVKVAKRLSSEGKSIEEIVEVLDYLQKTTYSYLIPQDFAYLARGGRCSPMTAKLGGLLNLKVAVTLSSDGRSLEKFATTRTSKAMVSKILEEIDTKIDHSKPQRFYVVHADNELFALEVVDKIKKHFTDLKMEIEVLPLCPTCIVQGGPGCVAVQVIEE